MIVTNWHVLTGAAAASAKLVGRDGEYPIVGIVNADTGRDIVLVSVGGLSAPSLTLGNSSKVAVGDEVYAVGNPEGLEGTFSQGIVTAFVPTAQIPFSNSQHRSRPEVVVVPS